MTLKRLRYLLSRTENGFLQEDEEQELTVWYRSFAGDSGIIAQLSEQEKMLLERRMLQRIHTEIEKRRKEQQAIKRQERGRFWVWGLPLAAAFMGAAFIAWFFIQHRTAFSPEKYVTGKAQYKQLILPDKSTVWLCPSSAITYPATFTGNTREITLKGEALFEITPDKQHPFIIHSGSIQTKVTGTTLNVQAYEDQPQATVTLITGTVTVQPATGNQTQTLTPNERVIFTKSNSLFIKEVAHDAADILERKQGKFTYRHIPLPQLVNDLRQYFNADIILQGEVRNCNVFATFRLDDPIQQILEPIALSLNATWHKQGNTYIIKGDNSFCK